MFRSEVKQFTGLSHCTLLAWLMGEGQASPFALKVRPCGRWDKLKNLTPLKFIENQYAS